MESYNIVFDDCKDISEFSDDRNEYEPLKIIDEIAQVEGAAPCQPTVTTIVATNDPTMTEEMGIETDQSLGNEESTNIEQGGDGSRVQQGSKRPKWKVIKNHPSKLVIGEATFASWEPRHSRFCYPWKQYVHLGVVLRHLAYTAFALHGCLDTHIQSPQSVRALFKEPCEHLADEIVKVLLELAKAIKTHHQFSTHISDHLHEALQELDISIKSQPQLFLTSNPSQKVEALQEFLQCQTKKNEQIKEIGGERVNSRTTSKAVITCLDFSEALPFAAFASLLIEAVARLDHVIEEVEELGKVAHFKEFHEEEEVKITILKDCDDIAEKSRDLEHENCQDIMSRNLQYLLSKLSWCDVTHFHLREIKRVF